MAFPIIDTFPETHLGPYERQMGEYIVGLLGVVAVARLVRVPLDAIARVFGPYD